MCVEPTVNRWKKMFSDGRQWTRDLPWPVQTHKVVTEKLIMDFDITTKSIRRQHICDIANEFNVSISDVYILLPLFWSKKKFLANGYPACCLNTQKTANEPMFSSLVAATAFCCTQWHRMKSDVTISNRKGSNVFIPWLHDIALRGQKL